MLNDPDTTTESRLKQQWPPRCPHPSDAQTVEELLPYLRAVAERPYRTGLHPAWGLNRGERVLLRVDNWHDDIAVEATRRVLEEYECDYEVRRDELGPVPQLEGHDEVEIFLGLTKESAEAMDEWRRIEREHSYDKILWGLGGPILADSIVKVQRMPFLTSEYIKSPAHTFPSQLLDAIDNWTHERCLKARRVRITDPEGTDFTYTNANESYSADRSHYDLGYLDAWWGSDIAPMLKGPHPGHIFGKPPFLTPGEDAEGILAGTMNHIGPYPHARFEVREGRIVAVHAGGRFGEKLRSLMEETDSLQYPEHPDVGLLHLWEVAIGTNPKIHRPRRGYLSGWNCAVYERVRSGIIHLGFGSIISSRPEEAAAKNGMPVGHFHVHLYFPTMEVHMADGTTERVIEDGRLGALDDPEIRALASQLGNPADLLTEDWVPAIPGLNMSGNYWQDYARDPLAWTRVELQLCERWHELYNKLVSS